jgi:hypothetical protein
MRYCTVLLGNAWLGKHKNKLGACGNSGQTANHKRLFGWTLAIVAPELWPLLVIYDPKVRTAAAETFDSVGEEGARILRKRTTHFASVPSGL